MEAHSHSIGEKIARRATAFAKILGQEKEQRLIERDEARTREARETEDRKRDEAETERKEREREQAIERVQEIGKEVASTLLTQGLTPEQVSNHHSIWILETNTFNTERTSRNPSGKEYGGDHTEYEEHTKALGFDENGVIWELVDGDVISEHNYEVLRTESAHPEPYRAVKSVAEYEENYEKRDLRIHSVVDGRPVWIYREPLSLDTVSYWEERLVDYVAKVLAENGNNSQQLNY